MNVADYIVEFLVQYGVTDTFGIPGGVVLDLLYAMQKRSPELTPHLCYHEQGASFAAVGYAQTSGKLGVAYSTRGPGFTNMITGISDAWCDSIPTLFITAHAAKEAPSYRRIDTTQEIDTCAMVDGIVKYVRRVDDAEDIPCVMQEAYMAAMTGRKGPVVLDVGSWLWKVNLDVAEVLPIKKQPPCNVDVSTLMIIENAIQQAKRPILLIGNGIPIECIDQLSDIVDILRIPVLSGRSSHHILAGSKYYYGYMGSNGMRYANFILSKADLMISMGNRLNFPVNSKTYGDLPNRCNILRVEFDELELERKIPNSVSIEEDLHNLLPAMLQKEWNIPSYSEWLQVCETLKKELWEEDMESVPNQIKKVIQSGIAKNAIFSADIGCNEFWLSRACEYIRHHGAVLYSKNFATLGCALPKAIGAYYAKRELVVCFVGDQGLMFNAQELELISQEQLPILIVVINNTASGMIRDKEVKKYASLLHTTESSGYSLPNLRKIMEAYGIDYVCVESSDAYVQLKNELTGRTSPLVVDLIIDKDELLAPTIPAGEEMQNMHPMLDNDKYEFLNSL